MAVSEKWKTQGKKICTCICTCTVSHFKGNFVQNFINDWSKHSKIHSPLVKNEFERAGFFEKKFFHFSFFIFHFSFFHFFIFHFSFFHFSFWSWNVSRVVMRKDQDQGTMSIISCLDNVSKLSDKTTHQQPHQISSKHSRSTVMDEMRSLREIFRCCRRCQSPKIRQDWSGCCRRSVFVSKQTWNTTLK